MKKIITNIHDKLDWFRAIGRKTYPFVETNADGEKLYLQDAYWRRVELCTAKYGGDREVKCGRVVFWDEFLHLWGGVAFWAIAAIIHFYHGAPISLILPVLVIAYFGFHEMYIDRKEYSQPWIRGIIDWAFWGVPSILFILINVL